MIISNVFSEAIREFKATIVPAKSRIGSLSPWVFVFGGEAPLNNEFASCRSVFLTWAHESGYELANFLKTPENYKEWNQFEGYDNLVDFERDAGCISRGILLFSECPGALAELGAFCMDDVLCERLLVVIEKKHYDDQSFIRLGPIRRIEETHDSDSICVVNTTTNTEAFKAEVAGVGEALLNKVKALPKTQRFDSTRTRDQFLLVVDLVELFGGLTKKEIEDILMFMGIEHESKHLKRMLNLLALLGLIVPSEQLTQRFFVTPRERYSFIDYTSQGEGGFDRARFKLVTTSLALKADPTRFKAYQRIHGARQ
ncbi:MAG: retron St85 family effector protein [Gallionellaceae bacterium]|nr:retron St85 family effector protein [Gallionellaceae bacterium]